jgi:hypothetical protein
MAKDKQDRHKISKKAKFSAGAGLTDEMADSLIEWTEKMIEWGKEVRTDIIRLEGQAGFSAGDPGDPPEPPPWGV